MKGSSKLPVAILGAGFAGLAAAVELRRHGIPVRILEGAPSIGGLARSFHDEEGFTYDFGAHFITNRLAATLGLAAECRTVRHYREVVWLDGRTYAYPFGLARSPRFAVDAARSRLMAPFRGPAASARELFERRYGRSLTDEVAAPLLEAWSGVPADRLAPSVADKVATSVSMTMWLRIAGKLTGRAVAICYCLEQPESAAVWNVYPEHGVGPH
jgi:protoporphyrinogen oxidase